eukprot:337837_1
MSTEILKSHGFSIEMAITPSKTLSDIIVDPKCIKKRSHSFIDKNGNKPSMIITDWMWLGNRMSAENKTYLKKIGITHILNCSQHISCFHLSTFKYGRIPLDDNYTANLFDYFDAANKFIDECNPLINNNCKNKILIHCAAGVSRSASIVISYLMSRNILYNHIEKNIIDEIRRQLQYKNKVNYNILTLSESYYFVKGSRSAIRPNEGFLEQLEKFEGLYHNGNNTRNDIDYYYDKNQTMLFSEITSLRVALNRSKFEKNTNKCCKCVIL